MHAHLAYLKREGVTRDGDKARFFDAKAELADDFSFADRCRDDRHHFRFTISPEDGAQMSDLRAFAREYMQQMEADLGTKLDWIALDHWNTDNPHIHIVLRGRTDQDQDLVMSRDYISHGMRARASALITAELGPRSELEIRAAIEREVGAERWTRLDSAIRAMSEDGLVDLRAELFSPKATPIRGAMLGRMAVLEAMGLASPVGVAQWTIRDDAEPTLRAMGIRGDIIKTMHAVLTARGIDRPMSDLAPDADRADVTGRVVAKGLADELSGHGYAIVDGLDGRIHYAQLRGAGALLDLRVDSIVAIGRTGNVRILSDLSINEQVASAGATWLDRTTAEPESIRRFGEFAQRYAEARLARQRHLEELGLIEPGAAPTSKTIQAMQRAEIARVAQEIESNTSLTASDWEEAGKFRGIYRCRVDLASGRYALLDDGEQFALVPWRQGLERAVDREVLIRGDLGGIAWQLAPARALSR